MHYSIVSFWKQPLRPINTSIFFNTYLAYELFKVDDLFLPLSCTVDTNLGLVYFTLGEHPMLELYS